VIASSSLSTIHGLHGFFHSPGFVLARNLVIVFAVVFWLGLAFWVHRDARRRIDDPFLVLLATLLGLAPPYIGPVVYLLLRPSETIDDVRSRRFELQALEQQLARAQPSCPVCATMLRQPCAKCNAPLEALWQLCPYCATPVELTQADLDAALSGEARTIALVDDTIALVPQPEPRVADA